MVTFAAATKNSHSFPTRAAAQCRVSHFVAITCSDPDDSCNLYNSNCRSYAQLVSPSRDPIGFTDGNSLYAFYASQAMMDSLGTSVVSTGPILNLPLSQNSVPQISSVAHSKTTGWLIFHVLKKMRRNISSRGILIQLGLLDEFRIQAQVAAMAGFIATFRGKLRYIGAARCVRMATCSANS